jgi:hypothetical protein
VQQQQVDISLGGKVVPWPCGCLTGNPGAALLRALAQRASSAAETCCFTKRGGGERRWGAQRAAQLIAQHNEAAAVETAMNPSVLQALSCSFIPPLDRGVKVQASFELRSSCKLVS